MNIINNLREIILNGQLINVINNLREIFKPLDHT